MFLLIIAFAISFFFAMNIGASGAAAAMGTAYGGGAIKKRWIAMVLVGIAAMLGAVLGGGAVVKTIGGGIIASSLLSVPIVVIILASACMTLFFANLLGIPLSTSEVTIGSVVGVGIAYHSLFAGKVLFIVTVWLVLPFIAFLIAYVIGKILRKMRPKFHFLSKKPLIRTALIVFLIGAGCYEAFAAGMNNVANAVGPLVGAGLISSNIAVIVGGLFVALGAVALGGKVLETNGKKITKLSLLRGSMVSLTSGTLVIIASIFGLPVPLVQATTMAIFGIGKADNDLKLTKSEIVKRILKVWVISPTSALIISYILVQLFIMNDIYVLIAILSAFIMPVGYMSIMKRKKIKS
ncbi:inorganic phosphate transporter [Scopulibacillus cellulosilyticus]|uniref:Anion permease n=1 Tax=Scopulibacillus cellulosilyticus TaxID=2665665 RepID=A0ABW2PR68_9BACL